MAAPVTESSLLICAVDGCRNTYSRNPLLTFFRLPARIERRKDWLRLMGREDLMTDKSWARTRICEIHFRSSLIQTELNSAQKILKKFALPTLFMPHLAKENKGTDPCDVPIAVTHVGCLTDPVNTNENSTQTSEKDYLKEKALRFQVLCDKFLPKEMSERVKSQMLDVQCDAQGYLTSEEYFPLAKRIKFEEEEAAAEYDIEDVFVKTETLVT